MTSCSEHSRGGRVVPWFLAHLFSLGRTHEVSVRGVYKGDILLNSRAVGLHLSTLSESLFWACLWERAVRPALPLYSVIRSTVSVPTVFPLAESGQEIAHTAVWAP